MESTLALGYDDLVAEVGLFLGYGRGVKFGDKAFTSQQQAAIESCVRSGLRQFYFPPAVEGQEGAYDWSFLKPVASVTFKQGDSTVALPDDFGGFEGEITIASTNGQINWPIQLIGEGSIRQEYANCPTATGRPIRAALQPLRGTTVHKGQRFQLYLFPAADADYTLQFAYYILADCLTGALPFAYGGAAHAETVLESCLAIAEQRLDDSSTVHSAKFQERLRASISLDRRNKPQTLGYNADRSDGKAAYRRDQYWANGVTVNGVRY